MVKRRLTDEILARGMRVAERAAGAIMADQRGQEAMARAVGLAQRGLKLFEEVQERALHAAGLAARPDYDDLRKQVARLKRKAREISDRLEAQGSGQAPDAHRDDGSP